MAAYVFQEFPKWVGDVIVENAAEEQALLLALAEGVAVAVEQPSNARSPAAMRMQRSRERRREGKRTIPCDISSNRSRPSLRLDFWIFACGTTRSRWRGALVD
jgi:hypothetical protein